VLSYLEQNGFVYVFENTKTKRVKVGMTGVSIESRLKPLNKQHGNTTYLNGDKNLPISYWKFRIAYITKNYDEVESLSHKYLNRFIDKNSAMREIFNCSVSEADEAIKMALKHLNLFNNAKRINGWEELNQ